MSGIQFTMDISEVESLKEDMYLKGIIQGEKNVEERRSMENQLWQELTTKLRTLASKYGATFDEIDSCWRVKENAPGLSSERLTSKKAS